MVLISLPPLDARALAKVLGDFGTLIAELSIDLGERTPESWAHLFDTVRELQGKLDRLEELTEEEGRVIEYLLVKYQGIVELLLPKDRRDKVTADLARAPKFPRR